MKKVTAAYGFLLPSLVIYAAVITLLMATAARLAVLVVPVAYTMVAWCSYTSFYTAYDFITRHVACAPVEHSAWLKADTQGFMWRSGEVTKAVFIHEGALLYKEGAFMNGLWYQATTSLLAQGCQFTAVQLVQEGQKVAEFYCRAEIIKKPEHSWEYRQRLYG